MGGAGTPGSSALSLRDALPILTALRAIVKGRRVDPELVADTGLTVEQLTDLADRMKRCRFGVLFFGMGLSMTRGKHMNSDRKSTRLNSSHANISYAGFCLKKKT